MTTSEKESRPSVPHAPEQRTGPDGANDKSWICPYSRLDDTSQVLRRKDLADLGSHFTESLAPLRTLVTLIQDSNAQLHENNKEMLSQTRELRWVTRSVAALAAVSVITFFLQTVLWVRLERAIVVMDATITRIDDLERVSKKTEERVKLVQKVQQTESVRAERARPQQSSERE